MDDTILNQRQRAILELLRNGDSLSRAEIARRLSLTQSVASITVIRDLQNLVDQGVIECSGKARATVYRLSRSNSPSHRIVSQVLLKKKAVSKKVQDISNIIVTTYHPEQVILFGSHAWGQPRWDSDVDLLVIKKTNQPRLSRDVVVRKMLWNSNIPVDLLIYTPLELQKAIKNDRNLFLERIVQDGISLYEKNPIRHSVD